MSGEFPERKPSRGMKLEGWVFFFENGKTSKPMNIKCRLANRGFSQLFRWALEHDLAEGISKNLVSPLEESGSHRKFRSEILAHSDGLSTLTRKEKREFFHIF